jgi:hypothetical protein
VETAIWLGIEPDQYSTGGKAKLFGISKRGNVYLRKLLIMAHEQPRCGSKRDRAPIGIFAPKMLPRSHFPALRKCVSLTHRSLHRSSHDESTVTTASP